MGFWEDWKEQAEAVRPKPERPELPSSQDAPTECQTCGHVGVDVIYGLCARCDWGDDG